MDNKKQKKQEECCGYTTKDIIINVTITLIICLTVLIIASIVFDKEPEIVVAYEQLPTCSLNPITVGQTYEVNGDIMILKDIGDYRDDGFRLYFIPME